MKKTTKLFTLFFLLIFCLADISFANDELERKKLESEIFYLKKDIDVFEDKLNSQDRNISEYEVRIDNARKSVVSANGYLRSLDLEVERLKDRMALTEKQISMRGITVRLLEDDMVEQISEIKRLNLVLSSLLRALYEETRWGDAEKLFSSESLASRLNDVEYLMIIERKASDIYQKLIDKRDKLNKNRLSLRKEQRSLSDYKNQLVLMKDNMLLQKEAKKRLVFRSKMSQSQYKEKVLAARKKHMLINSEIKKLGSTLDEFIKDNSVASLSSFDVSEEGFSWPVDPSDGITAGFMDPQYQQVFGIPHYSIDLRAVHGSDVKAPKDGIVLKLVDGGDNGYSYMVLGHAGDITSTYGHLSGFAVNVGDRVSAGQLIAWVGGTPGTPGAGWMTTGSHLKLEVRKDGVPMDPMEFMPK